MISKPIHAWVLHKRASGDTSAYVTFFTREMGLVSALCKGGRTPKKQALLQAFTPLWLTLDVKRDWYYVSKLDVLSPSLILERDSLFSGLYINELIYLTQQTLEPSPELFDFYEQALNALTVAKGRAEIEVILRRFEWQFIMFSGYSMSLTHDARTGELITASNYYTFNAGEGFVLAKKGILGAHIVAMASDTFYNFEVLKSAKRIMRSAIDHVLDGKLIKVRELYKKV